MGRTAQDERAPVCVIVDCDQTVQKDKGACSDHVSTGEYKRLIRQREFRMVNLIAQQTSLADELMTVLEEPALTGPVSTLIEELAALANLCSAVHAVQLDREGRKSAETALPSPRPVWAERKLDQAARRISEEAEAVAAWVNRPHDPYERRGACFECGAGLRREARHCVDCGAPTLHAFKRDPNQTSLDVEDEGAA